MMEFALAAVTMVSIAICGLVPVVVLALAVHNSRMTSIARSLQVIALKLKGENEEDGELVEVAREAD